MKLAPLQLTDYFVHAIRVEALADYDPDKEQDLDVSSLHVAEKCFRSNGGHPNRFAIDLVIRQDADGGKNRPYAYELHMVGFIEVAPGFPADKLQRAVETNGPSMLFGAAREILRAATGRGPYGPVLIPSTTFFKSAPPAEPPAEPPPKKAVTKAAKKAGRKAPN